MTRTSESYEEAVKCLREWYDHPRLVQEEPIRSIMDALPVKNGSDKEIAVSMMLQHSPTKR